MRKATVELSFEHFVVDKRDITGTKPNMNNGTIGGKYFNHSNDAAHGGIDHHAPPRGVFDQHGDPHVPPQGDFDPHAPPRGGFDPHGGPHAHPRGGFDPHGGPHAPPRGGFDPHEGFDPHIPTDKPS